jgi:hypothetical protein
MALCIECSPVVQEVSGSIPKWDTSVSDALCRGCRWPWSSPYSASFVIGEWGQGRTGSLRSHQALFSPLRHTLNRCHYPTNNIRSTDATAPESPNHTLYAFSALVFSTYKQVFRIRDILVRIHPDSDSWICTLDLRSRVQLCIRIQIRILLCSASDFQDANKKKFFF